MSLLQLAMAGCGAQNMYLSQIPNPSPPPPPNATYGPHTQPMPAWEIRKNGKGVTKTEKTCRFGVLKICANLVPYFQCIDLIFFYIKITKKSICSPKDVFLKCKF
jgi:hypothetical protein